MVVNIFCSMFFSNVFHFPHASGKLCFFHDGGPFGRSPNPTLTAWKRNGKETKLSMLVPRGPSLNQSPLMPCPCQFSFDLCIFVCFTTFGLFFFCLFFFCVCVCVCVFLAVPFPGSVLVIMFPFLFHFYCSWFS